MNLTIPNVTPEQAASIQSQLSGGAAPAPAPGGGASLDALKAAPSNWAAYTFANAGEWAALDALYGVPAVNDVKNYYRGPQAMYGYPNPGNPNTTLREDNAKPPIRYFYTDNTSKQTVEDTGQADAVQAKLSGRPGPTLPIR